VFADVSEECAASIFRLGIYPSDYTSQRAVINFHHCSINEFILVTKLSLSTQGAAPCVMTGVVSGNTALFGKTSCHCSLTPPNPISSVSIAMSVWLA
jgi:hypothetical protein